MSDSKQIDLARMVPFRLGPIVVEPALRQVSAPDLPAQTLEPRVMQVLVALVASVGEVVTRDDLIQQCWDGRIVGEDSISRPIAQLRKLNADVGGEAFHIDTIAKVGYRLTGSVVFETLQKQASVVPKPGQPAAAPVSAARTKPRWWLAVMAALGAAAIFALVWQASRPEPRSLRATLRIGDFKTLGADVPPSLAKALESEFQQINSGLINPAITVVRAPPQDRSQSYVVSGSIRRIDDSLRAIVDLTHEASGETVMSQSFDRPVLAGESRLTDIAYDATANIGCVLTYSVRGRSVSLPRTTMRLLAQWCRADNGPVRNSDYQTAVIREIVKTSPDFSAGWALLAAQLASATPDREKITGSPRFAEAQAALATAERIGPPGFAILNARARMLPANDLVGREPIFRESAERFSAETGGLPTFNYANFLLNVGRVADGDTQNRLGLQINPSQRRFQERQAYILFLAGKSEAAAAAFAALRANAPGRDIGLDEIVSDALMRSNFAAARAGVAAAREVDPAVKAAMNKAIAALESGNASARAAAADQLVELAAMPGTRERFMVAALAALDRDAEALQTATLFFQGGPTRATHILFQPTLEEARRLPAFAKLADGLGLMAYWRESKHPPDFCASDNRPALCIELQARS